MKNIIQCLFVFFVIFCASEAFLKAEVTPESIEKDLPKMLGAANAATEFWFTIPPCYQEESTSSTNSVRLYITCDVFTSVTVDITGKGFSQTKNTKPNDVIEFNINPATAQPFTKLAVDAELPERVYPNNGIHITAGKPIVVYCVVRFKNLSEGFLPIPAIALGKEYIFAGYNVDPWFQAAGGYKLPNECGIVAAYDGTKVQFTLGGNPTTRTAGGMMPLEMKEATLMKGDVWMITTKGDNSELSGSKIVASKPVAVVSGNECANIPVGNKGCSYIVEMNMPTNMWGKIVPVAKIPNRKYAAVIKVFARDSNTKFYRNGNFVGNLLTGGGLEDKGYQTMRITEDLTPHSAIFTGDKPINVVLYNTGQHEETPTAGFDPFQMNVIPYEQFMYDITFCTPGVSDLTGLNFTDNYINLLYQTDQNGKVPEDLEFASFSGGKWVFRKVKNEYPDPDEIITQLINGKEYGLKTITLAGDGIYRIRAPKPFIAYSFGKDVNESYGYPTASAFLDLDKPDTVPPVVQYTLNCDGSVDDGKVTDMPDNDSIRANLAMVTMNADSSYNYVLEVDNFTPGNSRSTGWRLKITDIEQDGKAIITFVDRRGNLTTVTIEYLATKLSIVPNIIDFGQVQQNRKYTSGNVWLYHKSGKKIVRIDSLKMKSIAGNFTISGKPLPINMDSVDSTSFTVSFQSATTGKFADTVLVADTCMMYEKAVVTAEVLPPEPIINVKDADYGQLNSMQVQKISVDILNDGADTLRITGIIGPKNAEFTTNLPTISGTKPLNLEPFSTKTFEATFVPKKVGKLKDSIVFINNSMKGKGVCYLITEVLPSAGIPFSFTKNKDDIFLSANPATDKVVINFNNDEQILSIKIFNDNGNLLDEKFSGFSLSMKTFELNTSSYPSGIYFVQVETSTRVISRKFVVVK